MKPQLYNSPKGVYGRFIFEQEIENTPPTVIDFSPITIQTKTLLNILFKTKDTGRGLDSAAYCRISLDGGNNFYPKKRFATCDLEDTSELQITLSDLQFVDSRTLNILQLQIEDSVGNAYQQDFLIRIDTKGQRWVDLKESHFIEEVLDITDKDHIPLRKVK